LFFVFVFLYFCVFSLPSLLSLIFRKEREREKKCQIVLSRLVISFFNQFQLRRKKKKRRKEEEKNLSFPKDEIACLHSLACEPS